MAEEHEMKAGGVRAAAVLVAAGRSTRMAAESPAHDEIPRKPHLLLAGAPVIERALDALVAAETIVEVIVVAHPEDVEALERRCVDRPAFAKVVAVVPGGESRADSVRFGSFWCGFDVDVVAVHDAARPLVEPEQVDAVVRAAAADGAALLAVPVQDTVKVAPGGRHVESTLDRTVLWSAQTPQCFRAGDWRDVLLRAEEDAFRPTDDAALWERYAGPVSIVRGDPSNLKLTTPRDLLIAEALLQARGVEA